MLVIFYIKWLVLSLFSNETPNTYIGIRGVVLEAPAADDAGWVVV